MARSAGVGKLNVLLVSHGFSQSPRPGRLVPHVLSLSRSLSSQGHSVTVITSGRNVRSRSETSADGGFEVLYLGMLTRHRKLTVNPAVIGFCVFALRHFDVVHIFGLFDLIGPPVAFFCQLFGIPYLVEPMGMHPPKGARLDRKRLYHRVFGRRLLGGAEAVVAASSREFEDLVSSGVARSKVVLRRLGVEIPSSLQVHDKFAFRRRWRIPLDAPLVLFVGRIDPIKGLHNLIAAMASLDDPVAWLVLAGPEWEDGYRSSLERLAMNLGLESRLLFPGSLYDDDKVAALRSADIFVLPSQSENFGLAAAEALACGTPVVVTDQCGIAQYIKDRAGLVIPYGVAPLKEALSRLLSDDDLYIRLRANTRAVAGELSWDDPVSKTEDLYRAVRRGRPC